MVNTFLFPDSTVRLAMGAFLRTTTPSGLISGQAKLPQSFGHSDVYEHIAKLYSVCYSVYMFGKTDVKKSLGHKVHNCKFQALPH